MSCSSMSVSTRPSMRRPRARPRAPMLRSQPFTAVATSAAVRPSDRRCRSVRRGRWPHRRSRRRDDRSTCLELVAQGRAAAERGRDHLGRRGTGPVLHALDRARRTRTRRRRGRRRSRRRSWYEYGIRSRNAGGSSGNSSAIAAGDAWRRSRSPRCGPTPRARGGRRAAARAPPRRTRRLGREEHRPELAHHDVERRVVVRAATARRRRPTSPRARCRAARARSTIPGTRSVAVIATDGGSASARARVVHAGAARRPRARAVVHVTRCVRRGRRRSPGSRAARAARRRRRTPTRARRRARGSPRLRRTPGHLAKPAVASLRSWHRSRPLLLAGSAVVIGAARFGPGALLAAGRRGAGPRSERCHHRRGFGGARELGGARRARPAHRDRTSHRVRPPLPGGRRDAR